MRDVTDLENDGVENYSIYRSEIKGAPWDDINFGIYYQLYEVVCPADHDFNFSRIFRLKKTFLSTFLRIQR